MVKTSNNTQFNKALFVPIVKNKKFLFEQDKSQIKNVCFSYCLFADIARNGCILITACALFGHFFDGRFIKKHDNIKKTKR